MSDAKNSFGRRGFLGVTAAMAANLPGIPAAAASNPRPRGDVALRWWGNNSWELRLPGGKVVLIDPWLTRFKTGTYTKEGADPNTRIEVNRKLLDGLVDSGELRADHILVTHGHYDHISDVPHLAARTGATVIGTETHLSLLAALGAPEDQLALATGGEFHTFDGYSIRVLRSLHSASGDRAKIAFPGTRPLSRRDRPRVISDLLEGGTLAYQVESESGFAVLNFGGSNYVEGELAGLRPDVLLLPAGGDRVEEYVPRLLRTLGFPPYVVPTHWDDFDFPLDEPAKDWGGLAKLRDAVAGASPGSAFRVVDHREVFAP
ncbi:MBL fold metallo-hydrolase [Amycolatopsis albispora]|uniref:MBL fold metallo-hydrolase n=1 Tax=Amycolatopsis albispora TaxID=1804986 RepID=A0A344LHM7_9PSEU|nr:MBL fold metallo-hydrolase [Amycolatopsis albispora]AXB47551.1 MBL fold metallo-hydrolase [Amycolatopsis albispora]